MAKLSVSVQLYTLRDLTKTDFAGTVKEVARIGYKAVELAGYGNLASPAEVKKVLDDAGLKISSAHVGIETLESNLGKVMDEQDILGNQNIVCPYMPDTRRKDAAGWKQVAESLAKIAAELKKRKFNLAYHNHSFEFQQFDGQTGMDILWGSSDPQLVKSELDVYWVKHGGQDPVQYLDKLGKRVLLLHLKDMAPGEDRKFAEVGTGTIDMKGILAAAAKYGIKWGIVEQDNTYQTPPLEAIRTSLENLKKLGVA